MTALTSRFMRGEAVHLRNAVEADYAAICSLTLEAYQSYAQTMPEPAWNALRQAVTSVLDSLDVQEAEKIIAEHIAEHEDTHENTIVGSVLLYPPTKKDSYGQGKELMYPELRLLAVAPQARGLGVGRALVNDCARRAKGLGAQKLGLHSSDYMEVATKLYLNLGFVRVPKLDFEAAGPHTVKGYQLELS